MAAAFGFIVFLIAVAALPLTCRGFPAMLTLERAFPMSPQGDLSQLVQRDRARHSGMMLQPLSSSGVVDFQLHGTLGLGIYSTWIKLGSPLRDFYVQIDTGSDALWVSCKCDDCPSTGVVHSPSPRSYDPRNSSTAHAVGCTDRRCPTGCSAAPHNLCNYTIEYVDESLASGYYISDLLHFETILSNSEMVNASAPVVFGCSTQVVDTTTSFMSVDGILGLGQKGISVISQLTSQRIAPRAFSHCLRGDGGAGAGGFLVLGAIVEPNMVYTPLVPFQSYYNVNLRSISVNGQRLPIDPSVFTTSSSRGTVIDSGTTLAYLVDEAYYPFVHAVSASVSQVARPFLSVDGQCYSTSSNVSAHVFPEVRLDFEGGASLLFGPQDYLRRRSLTDGAVEWCLQFLRNEGYGFTILGDLVMQNKMFVYDLAAQRIGWVDHNCSMPLNVSTVDMGNIGQDNSGGHRPRSILLRAAPDWTLVLWIMVLLPLGLRECGGLW